MEKYARPLLDLAAVKYIVTKPSYATASGDLIEVYSDRDATIYRSENALPRAHFASKALSLPNGFEPSALKGMIDQLRTGVVLEGYSGPRVVENCDASAATTC